MPEISQPSAQVAPLPRPASELRSWLIAGVIGTLGVAVLLAVLTGAIGRTRASAPPPVLVVATTPAPGSPLPAGALGPAAAPGASGAAGAAGASGAAVAARPGAAGGTPLAASQARDAASWIAGFYPIYATAQSTFGVNWLLLASIHMQESAFSTAPSTYHGLNFAHCCGGPMQFNVTNGPVSTWRLVADSYLYGRRPASYDHPTATHPSIYDDFDSIMAAAHLLSADGAGAALDGSAWAAAYDYYGHDATGVEYADTVLARAIGWSQHGFCVECGVRPRLLEAVHAAYGAPVLAALEAAARARALRARRGSSATRARGSKGARTRARRGA